MIKCIISNALNLGSHKIINILFSFFILFPREQSYENCLPLRDLLRHRCYQRFFFSFFFKIVYNIYEYISPLFYLSCSISISLTIYPSQRNKHTFFLFLSFLISKHEPSWLRINSDEERSREKKYMYRYIIMIICMYIPIIIKK